jgi:hypothetical protein
VHSVQLQPSPLDNDLEKTMNKKLGLVVLTMTGGFACTPLRMGVPADLAQESDVLQVTDRSSMTGAFANESFKMGPYEISNVDRKWNSSSSGSSLNFSANEAKTGYAFTFKTPQGEAKAQCGSKANQHNTSVMGFDITTSQDDIGCACEGAGASGKIQIGSGNGDTHQSQVNTRGGNFTAVAVMRFSNGSKSSAPIGYEFRAQNVVSAVELAHPGQLWMAKSLDEPTRADLACMAAGLLLYIPPKQDR